MPIEYAPVTPERLEDLASLLLPAWNRRWEPALAESIFRWRFLERANGEGLLAYDGRRPVAFVDSFLRLHRTPAGLLRVREPADWYCHPDYRPVVGLRVLARLFEEPEPILVVGGTPYSQGILPRLGARELHPLTTYFLPLRAGSLAKGLSKTFGFSASAVPREAARGLDWPLRRAPTVPGPAGGGSVRLLPDGDVLPELPPSRAYGLSPLFQLEERTWLGRAPEDMGDFVWLAFEGADGARGTTLSRVYRDGPFRAARLLHLEAAGRSVPLYAWMIAETVRALEPTGPQWVTARFECPVARDAACRVGFRPKANCRVFWWHGTLPPPRPPLNVGWSTNDEGLLPYPS